MRLFFELSKRAFRRQLSYRAATLAGLATNFFWGILRAMLMIALFGEKEIVEGFTLDAAVTFTGLTQASIGFLSMFYWYDLMRSVYSGDVASDLLKPMGYFRFWLAQDLGRAAASFFTRGVPIIIAYDLAIDVIYPQSPSQWFALILVIPLAWLVSFSWRFLANLAAFWFPNALGFGRFFFLSSMLLSGFLMPLRFFPDWVQRLTYLTPFPYTINIIVETYLGILTGPDLALAILYQALWAAALIVLGQFILRAGVRKLVILGG